MADPDQLFTRFGRTYPSGEVLFKDGEAGREMYVIQAGRVRICKQVRDIEKTLAILGPGEFFGEMAILNDKPRSATAIVEEDARLLVIDSRTFEAMVTGNTEIALRIIRKLAKRLDAADSLIEVLLYRDPKARVILGLSKVAEQSGQEVEGGIFVPISAGELADQVGLDEPVAREVIERLEKNGMIQEVQGGWVVSDIPRLQEFLEFLEMKEKFGDL